MLGLAGLTTWGEMERMRADGLSLIAKTKTVTIFYTQSILYNTQEQDSKDLH